jgi:4-hydroxy-tetrahydrodipicolinate reductase
MTQPIRVGIAGVLGRMGRAVADRLDGDPEFQLVGGLVRAIGERPPTAPRRLETDPAELLPEVDVLIDVTLPSATATIARACTRHGTPLVCGVTGLDAEGLAALETASERVPVWYARNLGHGVGVLLRLLPALAAELEGYDVAIVERHHRHKRDAPSGTALALARAIHREGTGEIEIRSVREGDITGEHEIVFTSGVEQLTVAHRALSRSAFAAGAVRAARAVHDAEPGWYGPEGPGRVGADR